MKYNDHEFDPVTDEERAAREREEELARRFFRVDISEFIFNCHFLLFLSAPLSQRLILQ